MTFGLLQSLFVGLYYEISWVSVPVPQMSTRPLSSLSQTQLTQAQDQGLLPAALEISRC